jgi:hypothetical protein
MLLLGLSLIVCRLPFAAQIGLSTLTFHHTIVSLTYDMHSLITTYLFIDARYCKMAQQFSCRGFYDVFQF